MAFKVVFKRNPALLVATLKAKNYFHRVESPGVVFVPSNQGYGDAEDLEHDLKSQLTNGSLSVTEEDDPKPDASYHQ